MEGLDKTVKVIAALGAIDYGLATFNGFEVVDAVLGGITLVPQIVYAIVGLAGIWALVKIFR